MNAKLFTVLVVAVLIGSGSRGAGQVVQKTPGSDGKPQNAPATLQEERRNFSTKVVAGKKDQEPVAQPPADLFRLVHYDSPVGKLPAYLSLVPSGGRRHPAIIWIHGGDCNDIGPMWEPGPRDNDQSAAAFWKAAIVTMYPALRGGNGGTGNKEGFYGEVDDVIAAAKYLADQKSVDPKRIYLGGHSTGGTMALLVAESSDRFRAVFSFGPVGSVRGYGAQYLPFDTSDKREIKLRSPIYWLGDIRTPTFVFEGATGRSNIGSLLAMARVSRNPAVHFLPVKGANHFSILFPVTRLVAEKIMGDDGATTNIAFTSDELVAALSK